MSDRASLTDEELVERAREAPDGDLSDYEALVRRYQRKVLTNCRYLTRSPDDAEDLAQDVFLKVFFGLKSFEGRSSFKTWLLRVKSNHCLNHLKKQSGKTFVDVEDPVVSQSDKLSVAPMAERKTKARNDRERIRGILDGMSDTLRVPLIMRDLDQLSYQEIAEVLGLGMSAVKMRIKRAREEFQAEYELLTRTPGDEVEPA